MMYVQSQDRILNRMKEEDRKSGSSRSSRSSAVLLCGRSFLWMQLTV